LQAPFLGVVTLTPQLTVIIRDDDVSACTRPEMLRALYGGLWAQRPEAGPVCLAVVPVLSEHVPRLAGCWDPNPDTGVWAFLRELSGSRRAEIALHGYRHAPGEWAGSDPAALRRLLDDSLARLEIVLPGVPVRTFIPPHERFSPAARDLLIERGFNSCTTSANMFPPNRWGWLVYRLKQRLGRPGFHPVVRQGNARLFVADTYLFTPDASPAVCLRRARRAAGYCARRGYPLVVVNHHWHFFDGAGQPRPGLLAAWREFVAELSTRDDVTFATFSAGGAPW
jgi:hypothetical protein